MLLGTSIFGACSASPSSTSPPPVAMKAPPSELATAAINSPAQKRPRCGLTISTLPGVKGLKLGMTPDEVLALFPGSKEDAAVRAHLSQPTQLGSSQFVIRPEKYENKADYREVTQITLTLLDGRVANFTLGFNGPQWNHVDQFVAKFIEGANFPPADQWEAYPGMDTQMKTLTCADFSIRIFAGGEGGRLNYVLLQDLEADKKLKDRRKKAREQASPTPGKQ